VNYKITEMSNSSSWLTSVSKFAVSEKYLSVFRAMLTFILRKFSQIWLKYQPTTQVEQGSWITKAVVGAMRPKVGSAALAFLSLLFNLGSFWMPKLKMPH